MRNLVKKLLPRRVKGAVRARIRGTRWSPLLAWAVTHNEGPRNGARQEAAPPPSGGQPQTKVQPKSRSQPQRECAERWPDELCACDAHLTAFGQRRLIEDVIALFDDAGIAYEDLGGLSSDLAIDAVDMARVESLLSDADLTVETETFATNPNSYEFPLMRDGVDLAHAFPSESRYLHVVPPYACASRRRHARQFGVRISAYTMVEHFRCFHARQAPTRVRVVRAGDRRESQTSGPSRDEAIDVVFTTVDGSDPGWQRRFHAAISDGGPTPLEKTVNAARYTSHGELRYAMRSIHYYAPYVRRIHVVTDDQRPAWLDATHPRVNLVDHRDIIQDEYLPTFNSDSIESFLWRIPELSTSFLYFNDDVLLMNSSSPRDFFTENGLPKFFPSLRLPQVAADETTAYTLHAHLRTAAALAARGYPRPVQKFKHAPFACVRSVLEDMEREFADELAMTRQSRVRSADSYATISFLYPHVALAKQAGAFSRLSCLYIELSADDWEQKLLDACRRTNLKSICVNESNDAPDGVGARLVEILDARFPVAAPWER